MTAVASNLVIHDVPLSDIGHWLEVRALKPSGVAMIKKSLGKGWQPGHAAILARVDGALVGLSGRHRHAAASELGLPTIPSVIFEGLSELEMLRVARQANEAAESVVPTTFVDDAELVWRELAAGRKQQALAEAIGWSREKVKVYSALQKIASEAWSIIGTTFDIDVPVADESVVPRVGTTVPSPFTEGLLRSILDLTQNQQIDLVSALAGGFITKGGFKSRAENYAARNALVAHVRTNFVGADAEMLDAWLTEVDSGAYDRDWRDAGPDGPKVRKLLDSFREQWERKTSTRLLHGDCMVLHDSIEAESVDAILSDPPYNVSKGKDNDIKLPGDKRLRDFGDWDRMPPSRFISKLRAVALQWYYLAKPGAAGYAFMSDLYLSHLMDALRDAGFCISGTIVWTKPNMPPKVRQTSWLSAVEYIVYFTKTEGDKSPNTFNWQGHHEMLNFFSHPLCADTERVKDAKGETLNSCQKPEAVIQRLLEVSTNRGDLVLDSFMGVGTVPAVAKRMGRKCIGIEADERFYNAAVRRLS